MTYYKTVVVSAIQQTRLKVYKAFATEAVLNNT